MFKTESMLFFSLNENMKPTSSNCYLRPCCHLSHDQPCLAL